MAEIDGVKVKIEGDASSLKSALNESKTALAGLGLDTGKLSSLLGAAGLGAAVAVAGKALIDLGRKAMECQREFIQAEVQQIRFNAAVAASSKITAQGQKVLEDLAGAYAKLSGEDDDAILGMEAMLIATGRTTEEIQKMLPAALGLATATGVDLNTALDQLNKTFSGTAERLAQTTPELKDLTEEELSNGRAVDVMLEKYGELSTALAGSGKVSVENYKTALGNLHEAIGQGVERQIRPMRDAIAEVVQKWADAIAKHEQYIAALKKTKDGTASVNDELIVQQEILGNLQAVYNSSKYDPMVSKEELAVLDQAIKEQQTLIASIQNKKTAEDTAAAAKTQQSKEDAKAAALQAEKDKDRAAITGMYFRELQKISREQKAGILTTEQAETARVSALRAEIDALDEMIAKYGMSDPAGATIKLRDAEVSRLGVIMQTARATEEQGKADKKAAEEAERLMRIDSARMEGAARSRAAYYAALEAEAQEAFDNEQALLEEQNAAETEANTGRIELFARGNIALNRLMLANYELYLQEKARFDKGYSEEYINSLEELAAFEEGFNARTNEAIASENAAAAEEETRRREKAAQAKIAEEKRLMEVDSARWEAAARGYSKYYFDKEKADKEVASKEIDRLVAQSTEITDRYMAGLEERKEFEREFNERRDGEFADAAAQSTEEETTRREEAIKRFHSTYKEMESSLTASIENERDARRKALLSSLLEEVKAAYAAGKSQEETRKKVAEAISKYDISKEIRDQYSQIVTASEWSTKKQIEYLEGLKLLVADTSEEFRMLNDMIDKLRENDAADIAAEKMQAFTGTFSMVTSTISQAIGAMQSYFRATVEAEKKAIQAQLDEMKNSFSETATQMQIMYDALDEMGATQQATEMETAKDKADDLDKYSKLELAQLYSLYATAADLGKKETAQTIQEAITRVQAQEAAENELKKLEYDAALQSWNLQVLSAAAQAAQASLNAYSSTAAIPMVGTTLAPFAAAAAAGFGLVQLASVQAAKPTKLDTGGIVRARDDTSVTVGRGTGEVMFGTSALGDPMMKGFADMIAARINSQPIVVQLALDGKVIAESTVLRINNGQVRLKR